MIGSVVGQEGRGQPEGRIQPITTKEEIKEEEREEEAQELPAKIYTGTQYFPPFQGF